MPSAMIYDDAYRGTHLSILYERGLLIAQAVGNGVDYRAIVRYGDVSVHGSAPQQVIDRLNGVLWKISRRVLPAVDGYRWQHE